ncbi:uncharacterized protein LOC114575077 [Exaiptasia diaphana]|uniref:Uncharacterized protein n=1 Tax=Exaiptasia diaphana TaxID=2652724 RepID=A0A913YKG2_EXADI|nr:uncharacterized protein LOC114575077 [Exaiptasia diaphana]
MTEAKSENSGYRNHGDHSLKHVMDSKVKFRQSINEHNNGKVMLSIHGITEPYLSRLVSFSEGWACRYMPLSKTRYWPCSGTCRWKALCHARVWSCRRACRSCMAHHT